MTSFVTASALSVSDSIDHITLEKNKSINGFIFMSLQWNEAINTAGCPVYLAHTDMASINEAHT
jgi:hypothetical protein